MKILNKLVIIFVLLLGFTIMFSQKVTTQAIDKPSEGKSLVYVLKTGGGALLNFRIYDNDKFLGALPSSKYLVYECEPGKHLFWSASENRDFVEANLEPNSVYVLNAEGQMGAFVAGVSLKPLNPNEFKDKRTFYQVIKNAKKQEFSNDSTDKEDNIKKGLAKYYELKNTKSNKIVMLDKSWTFENADKPVKDK